MCGVTCRRGVFGYLKIRMILCERRRLICMQIMLNSNLYDVYIYQPYIYVCESTSWLGNNICAHTRQHGNGKGVRFVYMCLCAKLHRAAATYANVIEPQWPHYLLLHYPERKFPHFILSIIIIIIEITIHKIISTQIDCSYFPTMQFVWKTKNEFAINCLVPMN